MTNAEDTNKSESRNAIGYWVSLIYAGLLISYIIYNWSKLASLPPNELGDFTAGAFGPMAILWLVLGYFQQGDELKQNTSTLQEQAVALAKSVHQQELLVAISKEQLDEAKREAQRESARLRAAARPKFDSEIFDTSTDSDGTEVRVMLTNVGAPCSHFRVVSVTSGVQAGMAQPEDGTQTRLVRLNSSGPERMEQAEFLVSYLDSAGQPGSQTFVVSLYADEDVRGYVVSGEDDGRVWQHATASAAEVLRP